MERLTLRNTINQNLISDEDIRTPHALQQPHRMQDTNTGFNDNLRSHIHGHSQRQIKLIREEYISIFLAELKIRELGVS